MQYRKFGRTGLSISPIGLGTVNFSWLTNEADSFAILDKALERGVNFIDTSNNYNAGQTEALLGFCASIGHSRADVALAWLGELFPGPGGAAPEAYAW
jgi:NDP-hexose 2,3-enoyl reductase